MIDIYQVVENQRGALLKREYDAVKNIVRAYEIAEQQVENSIRAFQDKIKQAQDAGLEPSLSWYYQEARLENILREIRGHLDEFSVHALEFSKKGRDDAYELGAVHALRLSEMQVSGDVAGFHSGAFANAQALLVANSPLKEIFDTIGPLATSKARDVFARAVAEGWNPRKMASTLKRDIEGLTKNRAVLIARTEMIRSYRIANKDVYERNSDVLRGWRWTAAKTPATCGLCLALDGEIYPTSKVLVSHPACRCSMMPLPNTDFGGPEPRNGEEYFKTLPPADQDRILGKTKADMYRKGQITLKDNVGFQDSPKWGRQPVPRRLKDLNDGYKSNQLPSQRGVHKLSTFEPAPARKLSDLLTATEREANDPVAIAKKKWAEENKEYKTGEVKPTFKRSKAAPPYKALLGNSAKALEGLNSTVEEVALNDLVSTLWWARGSKVRDAIESLGDGPDLPIIFRDGETLFIHNGESLHRLQAKVMLGQTRASVRIYDVSQIVKQASPLEEIEKELKTLGVTITRGAGVSDQEMLDALNFAKVKMQETWVIPEKVTVNDLTSKGIIFRDPNTMKQTWVIPNKLILNHPTDPIDVLLKKSIFGSRIHDPKMLDLTTSKFSTILDANEAFTVASVSREFDYSKLSGVTHLYAEIAGHKSFDLPSLRMFTTGVEGMVEEMVALYRRGEYRLGMVEETFEKEFLRQAENIMGKRTLLPAYTAEENLTFYKTGGQLGSNPAGSYIGRDGVERYIKTYDDADKAWAEHLSMKFYGLKGTGTDTQVYVGADGKTRIASQMIRDIRDATINDHHEILENYVMDAFLANWDVVGASFDNIKIGTLSTKAYRIDAGGTWFYRAKSTSEKKWGECLTLGEWESLGFDSRGQLTPLMKKKGFNTVEDAAQFLKTQGEDLKKRLEAIGKDEASWRVWIDSVAPGMSVKTKERITEMIVARQKSLDQKIKDMDDIIKVKATPKPTPAPKTRKKKTAIAADHWDATNWVNVVERDQLRNSLLAFDKASYDLGMNLIESFVNDPEFIVMRNEKTDVLLQFFQNPEPDGSPPRFKSQHETGRSQGTLDKRLRKRVEAWLFRLFGKNVTKKEDSVIYGWSTLRSKRMAGKNPAQGYGDISCVIKKDVYRRTTMTFDDSLGQNYIPTPILDPGPEVFGTSSRRVSTSVDHINKQGGVTDVYGYREIQVHGQLSIMDIEEFLVAPSNKRINEIKALAAKYGIKVTIT